MLALGARAACLATVATITVLGGVLAQPVASAPVSCHLLADRTGDGSVHAGEPLAESAGWTNPALDIVDGDVASNSRHVVAVLRLASLDSKGDLQTAGGVEYTLGWRLGAVEYAVQLLRTEAGDVPRFRKDNAWADDSQVTWRVDGASASVSWTLPRSLLPELAGRSVRFTQLSASTAGYVGVRLLADRASAASAYVDRSPSCVRVP